MFRRILVPLDGSERAERALPVAARLARFSGGSITLLRILASPIELMDRSTEPPMLESSWASIARASDYLAHLAASEMLAGIETTAEVFKSIPAPAIIAAARSSQADIIVICSHGYTGATRRVLGSVAEKVALHAPIPVLVLHEERTALPDAQPGVFHPLRTLVVLDGSAQAEEAIEPAAYLTAALAAPLQGGLHLMRVVQPDTINNSMGDQPGSETMLQMASSYLGSTVDRLSEDPLASASAYLLPATWSVALDDEVTRAITRAADNGESGAEGGVPGGCDIVAIATHGFGGLPGLAMESITERVLKSIRLPLLIVRPLDIMERSNFTWDETALFTI